VFPIWIAIALFANILSPEAVGKLIVDQLISTRSRRIHRAINQ
jgi:hypothetical protein